MAVIKIKDLLLRTVVGFNPHELGKKQDLLLNIAVTYELQGEESSDEPEQALDYRQLCKEIIAHVENAQYNLLEHVAKEVVDLILTNVRVQQVAVEVDKPHALRFAESVSFSMTGKRVRDV
ncbi:FolB domain-containing protein [Geofilum rubicundum]|uniref:Dihydroneopterin triphosphate 2'-epimerase n=1 Tax=Geofilum rubicundum JCM 15548 TaxID=1236989 RepID=A0A0E9LZH5_9BACT|nr:FolB domain-containing protein [Geofilum rubicundum]GAO30275.1 dihydroneopterin triphosphate epimerase [Geofilum rubicundum JCM 15548]